MQWSSAILLAVTVAATSFNVVAQSLSQEMPMLMGAGCEFSDYDALHVGTASEPSYRLELDPGLGQGIYVLHFSQFHLPDNDVVVLRDPDTPRSSALSYALSGRNASGAFYSSAIMGNDIVVELYKASASPSTDSSAASTDCDGFTIDKLVFSSEEQAGIAEKLQLADGLPSVLGNESETISDQTSFNTGADESLCGTDESVEAVCISSATNSGEGAVMYARSQAVARLTINKENSMSTAYCTGFLLGCEGHLITNQHCIGNWLDALNTKVEFLAEAFSCSASETCETQGACPGSVGVTSTSLVAVSEDLDYALVQLTPSDGNNDSYDSLYAQTGGYLQFRASGPVLQEEIYIPQHPMGYGTRVAWLYNGEPGVVESLTVNECRDGDVGYYVDTQDGASGSPILAVSDNNVIALHHCGGCPNGAIPAPALIADLTEKNVLPACATVEGERK